MNQMIRNTKQEAKMNLQNAAYPVPSRPEELVPSRYALRVGEIDVLVVSDGVLPLPTSAIAADGRPLWATPSLTASQTAWSGQSEPKKSRPMASGSVQQLLTTLNSLRVVLKASELHPNRLREHRDKRQQGGHLR